MSIVQDQQPETTDVAQFVRVQGREVKAASQNHPQIDKLSKTARKKA